MKKTLPIVAVTAAALTIGASIALANHSNIDLINALGDKQSYTIEITSANATGSVVYDSDNWCYRFQLTGTTKRDGRPFNSDPDYSYFADYGGSGYTYGGDHILILNNTTATYGNSFIYLRFPFSGPAELQSAKCFYRMGTTTGDLSEESLTADEGGYYLSMSIPGNTYLVLEKISFKYNC